MVDQADSDEKYSLQDFEPLQEVLSIISSKNSLTSPIHTEVNSLLPASVSTVLQHWTSNSVEECTWVKFYQLPQKTMSLILNYFSRLHI